MQRCNASQIQHQFDTGSELGGGGSSWIITSRQPQRVTAGQSHDLGSNHTVLLSPVKVNIECATPG